MKKSLVSVLVFAVGLLGSCGGDGSKESPSARAEGAPSGPALRAIVLVTVEGLGRQALQSAGASAPILAELAGRRENGARFYTPIPLLLPAMTSLMTGTSPRSHGVLDGLSRHAPENLPTLAEEFHANGWSTAAAVASPFVSRPSGLARGFEVFDGAPGYSIAGARYYPKTREAAEVAGNGIQWLAALPKDRSGFLWIQLSDLAGPFEPKLGPPGTQARSRLTAVDGAIGRLREALAAPGFGSSFLVVTSDRGQILGERSDLDAGFLLEPAAIEVPLLLERIGKGGAASAATRPSSLTGLAGYLSELAGLTQRRITAPAHDAVLALSAAPWVSCRWTPAVVAADKDSLWLYDGSWRRFEGADAAGVVVAPSDVPSVLAEQLRSIAGDLAAQGARGPKTSAAEAAARKKGLAPGSKSVTIETPSVEERRSIVESLQAARALDALSQPRAALKAFRALAARTPPPLAALHDMTFLQATFKPAANEAWGNMTTLLATYGVDRMTSHGAAHAALTHEDRDLAQALLLAYLEDVKAEPDALYDLACLASVRKDLAEAQSYLERAIDAGFIWWDWIEQDPDLRNLRESPGFAMVMKQHGR